MTLDECNIKMNEGFQSSIRNLIESISHISSVTINRISQAHELVMGGDDSRLSSLVEEVRLSSRCVSIHIHEAVKCRDGDIEHLHKLMKSIENVNADLASLNDDLILILYKQEFILTIGSFLVWPPIDRCVDKKLKNLNVRLCQSFKLIDNLHSLLLHHLY